MPHHTPEERRKAKTDDPAMVQGMESPSVTSIGGLSEEFQKRLDNSRIPAGPAEESFGVLRDQFKQDSETVPSGPVGVLRNHPDRRSVLHPEAYEDDTNDPEDPKEILFDIAKDFDTQVFGGAVGGNVKKIGKAINKILPDKPTAEKAEDGSIKIKMPGETKQDIVPIGEPVSEKNEQLLIDAMEEAGISPGDPGVMRVVSDGKVSYMRMDDTPYKMTAEDVEREKYDRLRDLVDNEIRVREDMFRQQRREMRKVRANKMFHIEQFARQNRDPRLRAAILQAKLGIESDYQQSLNLIEGSRQNLYDGAFQMLQVQYGRTTARTAEEQMEIDKRRAEQRSALQAQKDHTTMVLTGLKDKLRTAGIFAVTDIREKYDRLGKLAGIVTSEGFVDRSDEEKMDIYAEIKTLETYIDDKLKQADEKAKAAEAGVKNFGSNYMNPSHSAASVPVQGAGGQQQQSVVPDSLTPGGEKISGPDSRQAPDSMMPKFPPSDGNPVQAKHEQRAREVVNALYRVPVEKQGDVYKMIREAESRVDLAKMPNARTVLIDPDSGINYDSRKRAAINLIKSLNEKGMISDDMMRIYIGTKAEGYTKSGIVNNVYKNDGTITGVLEVVIRNGRVLISSPHVAPTKTQQENFERELTKGLSKDDIRKLSEEEALVLR